MFFIETGRLMQMIGLFLWELLLGRIGFFTQLEKYSAVRKLGLKIGFATFAVLWLLHHYVMGLPDSVFHNHAMAKYFSGAIVGNYLNTVMMILWFLVFIELHCLTRTYPLLQKLAPCGKVSLSVYLIQAVICVPIFYPLGLGWYADATQAGALIFGLVFYVGLIIAAHWWVKRYHYGPVEWLWRAAIYTILKAPFKRSAV